MDKGIKLVGAPGWYGTPLEQLDFEWSREEELELERYCQRILKNIANEEMTPTARFEATMSGSEKDRLLIEALYFNPYAVRTLDPAGDALKPVEVCRIRRYRSSGGGQEVGLPGWIGDIVHPLFTLTNFADSIRCNPMS